MTIPSMEEEKPFQVPPWIARRLHREGWRFTWDTFILFAGNGVTSVLFLLFHMLAGRQMRGEDYAEFLAMIGLSTLKLR